MNLFDPLYFRQFFPLLQKEVNNQKITYFDNAATMQKPESVIRCYDDYYTNMNANVHRSSHALSSKATQAYELSRTNAQHFIHAGSAKEIIWTKGATESINLIAQSYARGRLCTGDEIVLTQSEHHANIVPWQIVAQQTGAIIKVLPLTKEGRVNIEQLDAYITSKTKIVCCAHISNVIGKINAISEIVTKAKEVGAITVIDGAQAVAHINVDVQKIDCDFYVFSAHKMYGPTGVGVLYGKLALLEAMEPYQAGGEMIKSVSFDDGTSYNELPYKFEAGTPNIAGVVAFDHAIQFIKASVLPLVNAYERKLTQYCYLQLLKIPQVRFIVEGEPDIPILSFTLIEQHNHDIASALDSYGIAVRSGHHCAMPLMKYLSLDGCIRVSLAPYNTLEEIDFFIKTLKQLLIENPNDNKKRINVSAQHSAYTDLTANQATEAIVHLFHQTKGWDGRHRQIMQLSKQLERMPKEHRKDEYLISGCESLAWLMIEKNTLGHYLFHVDSDAKVIRGLLVIILAAYNHKSAQQIETFVIEDYFEELGLIQHLSPSRGNGVRAIVDKLKQAVALNEQVSNDNS